jgi:hypothetical protein
MKDYKFCSKCGNKSRITANVCSNCGKRFSKVLVKTETEWCPQCASVHRAGAKFCCSCGYQFVPSVPTEAPIDQPLVPGVELPPAAKIPPKLVKAPEPTQPSKPISQRGATGLVLTVEELKRLRKLQTEQIVLYPRRKPNR